MKKLLLLTILTGWLSSMFAQTATDKLAVIQASPKDTAAQKLSSLPEADKTSNNPAFYFKDLFETDALAINANSGPTLNPRAVTFVEDYIGKYGKDLIKMKEWGRPFFNMMDGVFLQYSLPRELKYLAVIESRLNPVSVSWAGAVGPWQFMPGTATALGLKVNRSIDERTNYYKSTHAAAKYLIDLYKQFGDWLLVIAAYNGGPANVLKAIRKSGGSRNFWDIQYHLPAESRTHVKKFIATHYIFEGQGGLTTLTRAETSTHYGEKGVFLVNRKLDKSELENSKEQTVSGKYHSLIIARNITMDINEFNRYNPDFDKVMASSANSYEMKLPVEKMELFNANKYKILNESIQLLLTNAVSIKEVSNYTEKVKASKKRSGR
jgi:membrane-bound lytic murein transglycosylase D